MNKKKQLGKGISDYVEKQETPENQWKLYNYLTWYIFHVVQQRMRALYQIEG